MAIEKYTTQAIIIESFDQGENDRVYKLFTREFGMIMAHAKSIRKLESKLRAHVEPRTISLVTVVRGRDVWRLVGAERKEPSFASLYDICQLLRRFVRGESVHKSLFDRMVAFAEKEASFDKQKGRLLLYFVLLVELGYADAQAIGARDIKEYISWGMHDLYIHLLLSYEDVRTHTHHVLKETQL
jgi:recombinational DNA repair protein (RecF pathway)